MVELTPKLETEQYNENNLNTVIYLSHVRTPEHYTSRVRERERESEAVPKEYVSVSKG